MVDAPTRAPPPPPLDVADRPLSVRLPQALVTCLGPVLGSSRAEFVVARVYAVFYLVFYYLSAQYARALLGILWIVLTPLLFLAIYLPVLTLAFHGKLSESDSSYDLAFFMVAGILPWAAFSDGFGQAAGCLVSSPGIVRHAPIPPSLLPAIRVSGAFTGLLIGLTVFVVVLSGLGRFPGVRLLLLPPSFVLFFCFTLGLSWLASSVSVHVRDMLPFLPTLLQIEFFACPIVYPPSLAPGVFTTLIHLNPLTPFLALFRAALGPSAPFAWMDLAFASVWSLSALVLGFRTFRKLEDGFGDAL
jgi:ABC-type polysaccharide/polyol phosphate export permease